MKPIPTILDRIDLAGEPVSNARLTALLIFMGLYLAVGIGLAGIYDIWHVLTWPYWMRLVLRAVLMTLAAFAATALYVYWLKLRFLQTASQVARESSHIRVPISELSRCQQALQHAMADHKDTQLRLLAAQENARHALERMKQAESRAAAAEGNARAAQRGAAGQQSAHTGRDEKFRASKRAFAHLYHPDNVKVEGLDKIIRAEIFKEYWRELETIEKRGI